MNIVVNHSWRGQTTTGQQRYAQEVARRLVLKSTVSARPAAAPGARIMAWISAQTLALPRRRDEWLLTLTSRGPVWHPKHVMTIHDHFVLTNPDWYSRKYVLSHAPILRTQIAGARALVFVSEVTQERHWELFGDRVPSIVAPNGVQPPIEESPEMVPQAHPPFLLAVGSADPRKNIRRLVQAYESLPYEVRAGTPLVLVGGSDPTVFAAAAADAREHGGIVKLDYVTDGQLWALYRQAIALVMPSLDEGFGLPLIEAASVGTPLVVSDIRAFRWIAGNSAVYFDPRDTASIRAALSSVVTDPTRLKPAPTVTDRFNWDKSSGQIYEFIRSLE